MLEKLKELMESSPDGPWEVQDGCSWRRIGTPGFDGSVLSPSVNRYDGHPDLSVAGSSLDLIVALRNAAPALIEVAEAANGLLAVIGWASLNGRAHEEVTALSGALKKLEEQS